MATSKSGEKATGGRAERGASSYAAAASAARFTVSRRLLLIAAAFTLPLGTMLSLIDLDKDIAFARQELQGNTYQRPLETLLHAIGDHQRLALAALRMPGSGDAALAAAADRVDAAFAKLTSADAAVGARLQFTPEGLAQRKRDHVRIATLQQEWQQARAVAGAPADAIATRHAHLVADLRMLIAHAGDTSNLILDPDLDSYYVMDVTLLALPQTQDRTGAVLAQLQQIAARGRMTSAERRHLAVQAAFLREADRDRIVADADTALNEDANFYGRSEALQTTLKPAVDRYAAAATAFADALDAATTSRRRVDFDAVIASGVAAREASFALWSTAATELDALIQTRITHYEWARVRALGVSGLAWVGALGIVFVIGRTVTRRLDSTGRELAASAERVTRAAAHVAASAQSLSQGATEQAASLEETSASMEEMASMTRRNSDHAEQAAALVGAVAARVESSNAVLEGMVASMDGIRESSHQVARIIRTIDEIAFQTNILALNAAVEAARAGAAGMGFAVVADEVRTLAQRSAQAAKDTEGLIEASIARTNAGAARVEDVARAIASITESVARVQAIVHEVHEASQQQSQGISQVATALTQMEQVTQSTAATAEETAGASDELNREARMSMEVVRRLGALIGHANAPAAPTAPARAQAGARPEPAEAGRRPQPARQRREAA
jgi:methyl-accepting chemotaxis protein